MPRFMTLGLRDEALPPELDTQETEKAASENSRVWEILSGFGFDDGLGEILFEPGGLVVLVIIGLACVVIYFLVSGAVALVQEAFSSGPPQGLGLGS